MKERIEAVARAMVVGIMHGGARDLSSEAMDGVIFGAVRFVQRIDELWEAASSAAAGGVPTAGQFRLAVGDALLAQIAPSDASAEAPAVTADTGGGVGDGI